MSALTSAECDQVYDEYGGKSASGAGWEGALGGLSGMVGLGGFWHPVSDAALTNIENGFKDIQNKWTQAIAKYNMELNDAQKLFKQRQDDMILEIGAFNDEILSERIGKNSLYIAILFAALIIVIIYLIVL